MRLGRRRCVGAAQSGELPGAGNVRTPQLLGVATALALGVVVASLARWGPDWPAQEFRAWLGARQGWAFYTTRWYSGDSVLGYSVLFPPLAGAIGAGAVGVLACGVTTWAGCGLAPDVGRVRSFVLSTGIALATLVNLVIGQIPFLLGAAFAVLAVRLTLERRWPLLGAASAALASLASPLSGAFLLLCVPALVVVIGWRRSVPLFAAVSGSAVAGVVGGAGGRFPCPWLTFAGVVGFCAALVLCTPRENRALRAFAVCYLLAAVVSFAVPNPVGGNIARLGKLLALPLACCLVARRPGARRHQALGVLVAVLAVTWPAEGLVSSVARGAGDPSQNAAYYSGLDRYLARHPLHGERVEIPFTREHWEAYYVARHFPIARGWDRQSDLEYNAILYRRLTATTYRRWLDANAVGFVALPDAPIDFGGRAEQILLEHPPSYLRPVWHDAHWQVWRVRHPTPLISGPARVVDEDPTSLTLDFAQPGRAVIRFRSTGLWQTTSRDVCVSATGTGWTRIVSATTGVVTLTVGVQT